LAARRFIFRCHHLLTSGDGAYALKWGSSSAYKEDANGNPVYDWTINDKIFDTYVQRGIKPYVEIGFMPEALSTHPQDYPHNPPVKERAPANAGQAYPPKDYAKWGELVSVDETLRGTLRRGRGEPMVLGSLERAEHQLLARHARRIISSFTITPLTACGARCRPRASAGRKRRAARAEIFCSIFLQHCAHGTNYVSGKIGSPLDFISFHAKGSPVFQRPRPHGHGQPVAEHGRRLRRHRLVSRIQKHAARHRRIRSRRLRRLPRTADAYRNGTMYSSYTAASFPRAMELAEKHGVNLQGALTWAFEFEDQPPFAGFRATRQRRA
jgi:xylan 1,4-beta-xylosidase